MVFFPLRVVIANFFFTLMITSMTITLFATLLTAVVCKFCVNYSFMASSSPSSIFSRFKIYFVDSCCDSLKSVSAERHSEIILRGVCIAAWDKARRRKTNKMAKSGFFVGTYAPWAGSLY